jgi:guanylate kinase
MSVSHTTRKKRKGDQEGKDYYFIGVEEFKTKVKKGDFIEYAQVFENYYGTDKETIFSRLEKSNVFLEIDWQGAEIIKKIFPKSLSIFLLPPSYEDLRKRLNNRDLDSEEIITKRLSEAKKEISKCMDFDFLILNDEFTKALSELKKIVFENIDSRKFNSRVSSELLKNLLD